MRIAIIENELVTNVIEGELEVVKQLFLEVAPESEDTNRAWIGSRHNGQKFEAIKYFDSWTWNEQTFDYDPPTPKPEGEFYWSEQDGNWVAVPESEPEEQPEP
jgi:hypothetical protein